MAYEKKVTKSKFEAVKILLAGGASVKEIGKYLDLSDNTIYKIKTSETYEDYEKYVAEKVAKSQAARAIKLKKAKEEENQKYPKPDAVTITSDMTQSQANYQINRVVEQMKQMNDHLKLISNKLAFIVDELCGVPKMKEDQHEA